MPPTPPAIVSSITARDMMGKMCAEQMTCMSDFTAVCLFGILNSWSLNSERNAMTLAAKNEAAAAILPPTCCGCDIVLWPCPVLLTRTLCVVSLHFSLCVLAVLIKCEVWCALSLSVALSRDAASVPRPARPLSPILTSFYIEFHESYIFIIAESGAR